MRFSYFTIVIIPILGYCYSSETEKPFRMQKLNLVWEKASKRLSKEKLKSLYTDLKYQDKEELAWKKLKAEGLDKDGLKEALIRNSFNAILEKYDLKTDFIALQDAAGGGKVQEKPLDSGSYAKIVFKDKKLNKLWLKAEQQNFTAEELKTLKEEFQHHQDKIDQYYQLMEKVGGDLWLKDDASNTISLVVDAEEPKKSQKLENSPHQVLKEKHSELKTGYDYLNSRVVSKNLEFEEPQVNSLWELAKNASFSPSELESLRGELHHFEHRIRKLKHLTEQELGGMEPSNMVDAELAKRQKRIKEYSHKVEKVKKELADRIMQRHTEL